MITSLQLETPRLLLRPWQQRDRAPFAAMNADTNVMEFFAAPMTREQTDEAIDRYLAAFETRGFSFFAAELKASGALAGVIGLQVMRDVVPGLPQPAVEIGWRIGREHQRQGLATEGARAIVRFAFHELHLDQVVAITAIENAASRNVMEKLGMILQPELEFDHPRFHTGQPHSRHVLYQLINPRTTNRIEA